MQVSDLRTMQVACWARANNLLGRVLLAVDHGPEMRVFSHAGLCFCFAGQVCTLLRHNCCPAHILCSRLVIVKHALTACVHCTCCCWWSVPNWRPLFLSVCSAWRLMTPSSTIWIGL